VPPIQIFSLRRVSKKSRLLVYTTLVLQTQRDGGADKWRTIFVRPFVSLGGVNGRTPLLPGGAMPARVSGCSKKTRYPRRKFSEQKRIWIKPAKIDILSLRRNVSGSVIGSLPPTTPITDFVSCWRQFP